MTRKRRLPANVSSWIDRHGRERFRWRKTGHKPRYFTAPFGTPEFAAELEAFRQGDPIARAGRGFPRGTVGWLAARYRTSQAFTGGKNPQTERTAWAIVEKFVAEYAEDRIEHFRFDHIEEILTRAAQRRQVTDAKGRKRTLGGPHAARNLLGELKPFFRYAVKHGLIQTSPADLADAPAAPSRGFHCWTNEEIGQYRARWPLGTKARLALEIMLWTAQRKGDASSFGRRHMKDGKIEFVPRKTGRTVWLPAAPQLVEAIEAMAVTGTETFLVTDYGRPFTRAGLGNRMREWCDKAALPHCTAHGLRKAIARMAAEHGASNSALKALGGWTTDSQVNLYTAAVSQARLAEEALAPVIAADLRARNGTTEERE
jgi:integrase